MRRRHWLIVPVLLWLPAAVPAQRGIHDMTDASGEIDQQICAMCHEDDLSLSRSKVETCTLCHTENPHAGAQAHLQAPARAVERLRSADDETLPVTDEGTLWCGTCHLYHDPEVLGEEYLESAWIPARDGLSEVVRRSLVERWNEWSSRTGKEGELDFMEEGSRALRLSVRDGALCRHCHAEYGK